MKKDRRIVITGIGVLSSIGIGRDNFAEALLRGKTGFREISLFDTNQFQVRIAGEIADFDPVTIFGKKSVRSLDRSTLLLNSAAKLALDDSKFEVTDRNAHLTGVSVGTTFGSLHSIFQFDREGLIEGPRYVNPSHFPNTVINSPASQVSIRFKIKGFNTTISTGFCAGLDAVSYAVDFIKFGRAEVVLAGGVEELCEETFMGFYALGCLSGIDGSEPVCRPFDAARNGTILSEGAAVLALEEEGYALERGAKIIAVIRGCGSAFDPASKRDFSHKGRGLKDAIMLALEDASLNIGDIDYISSSANSTKGLDRMETGVIKEVFGKHAFNVPFSSVKSMIGESFSASGSLSLAAAAVAISNGFVPPTMNYREQDPECDLDHVVNKARKKQIKTALITAADPHGNNTAIVIGRYGY
jgi:3-oxoacyl-[acyl-carrier-protein] synthase II